MFSTSLMQLHLWHCISIDSYIKKNKNKNKQTNKQKTPVWPGGLPTQIGINRYYANPNKTLHGVYLAVHY